MKIGDLNSIFGIWTQGFYCTQKGQDEWNNVPSSKIMYTCIDPKKRGLNKKENVSL